MKSIEPPRKGCFARAFYFGSGKMRLCAILNSISGTYRTESSNTRLQQKTKKLRHNCEFSRTGFETKITKFIQPQPYHVVDIKIFLSSQLPIYTLKLTKFNSHKLLNLRAILDIVDCRFIKNDCSSLNWQWLSHFIFFSLGKEFEFSLSLWHIQKNHISFDLISDNCACQSTSRYVNAVQPSHSNGYTEKKENSIW